MAGSLRQSAVYQLLQALWGTGAEPLIVLALVATFRSAEFGLYAVALSLSKLVFLLFEGQLHQFLAPKVTRYLGRHSHGTSMWTRLLRRAEFLLNWVGAAACCAVAAVVPMLLSQFDVTLLLAATAYNGAYSSFRFSSLAVLRCVGEVRTAADILW